MIALGYGVDETRPLNILCLGAHSDDIEIGCGGSLLHLIDKYRVAVTWVVFGAQGRRRDEATNSANDILRGVENRHLHFNEFRNSFFPYHGLEIKEYMEHIKGLVEPDLVFTHYRSDLHQDHRVVSELTWNAFRNHHILEYEIPKFDGDLGNPGTFVPLSLQHCQRKIDLLMEHFASQKVRPWFSEETFWALLRLRGIECNSESGYAEAHYSRKTIVQ